MQQLGKYTVLRRLGVGGMAEVFLCKLVGIGGFEKHVVVKRIREDIADDEFVTMFFDEARLAANLSHPNIIQVFEVDQIDGMPYLAMEYVRGATLAMVLKKLRGGEHSIARPMDFGHVAYIFSAVCAGLDHAHDAHDAGGRALSIVHRDISPQNVIVSVDGTPKIFDFGVAKAKGSLALTGVDRVKGKFAYMAPEQLRAQPVDAKADIYAVGVCMYEAITGKRPFAGGTEAELYARRLEGLFTMPSELVPAIPIELEHLILSAMAPDPADRPTALELQESLAAFCGAGSAHASNALAVATWLKDILGEQTEAYEGYSSSNPSMTPLPRSANMPPTRSAVEASSRRASRGSQAAIAILSVAAVCLAGVLVWALVHKKRDPHVAAARVERVEVAAARTAEVETQRLAADHEAELERMRAELEAAKRAQAADDTAAAEMTVETAKRPEPKAGQAREEWKRKPAPVRIARVVETKAAPKPVSGAPSIGKAAGSGSESKAASGSGSGSGSGSAQIAQATAPTTSPPPARGSAAIAAPVRTAPVVAPAPAPMPAAPSPGSLDATPAFSKLSVDGSLTTTEIQAALARTLESLRSCYRGAAKRANHTPELSLRVSFEIDEGARASGVRVAGDTVGVAPCVKEAIGGVRTRVAPDVGTVSVSTVIRFKPIR